VNIAMVGPFGLKTKSTMRERALPMAQALGKRGHHVSVIVPPWDSPEDAGKSYLHDGVQIINTPLPKLPAPFFYLTLTGWLAKFALQQHPDIIHFFKPKAYAGLTHILLDTLRRFKRHSAALVVDEDDWERAWNAIEPYSSAQKQLFAWQEPWGITHADAVTVASKNLQYYAETLHVPVESIFYVPNGVRGMTGAVDVSRAFSVWQKEFFGAAMEAFQPAEPAGQRLPLYAEAPPSQPDPDFHGIIRAQYALYGKPVVLLYTRFFEFNLDFLLEVMQAVHGYLPATRWLIVGKGFFGEEEKLAQMVKAAGLNNRVIFTGWVDKAELPHCFAAANVAVYPYDDTPVNRTKCSVKLLDLLSAGVPVVASKVGQNAEYIRHRQTGVLVPPNDAAAMAQAVVAILSSSQAQQFLGQSAVQDVHHRFGWHTLAATVEQAYRQAQKHS